MGHYDTDEPGAQIGATARNLGILSILIPPIGLAAIICGWTARSRSRGRHGLAGVVLGLVGLTAGWWVAAVIVLGIANLA